MGNSDKDDVIDFIRSHGAIAQDTLQERMLMREAMNATQHRLFIGHQIIGIEKTSTPREYSLAMNLLTGRATMENLFPRPCVMTKWERFKCALKSIIELIKE